jgi:hypothetical protein
VGDAVNSDEGFSGGVRNVGEMQKTEIAQLIDRGNVTPKVRARIMLKTQEQSFMCCQAQLEGWGLVSPCAGRHAIRKCVAGALHYPGQFFGLASSIVQRLLRICYPASLHIMFDLPDAKRCVASYPL